MFSQFIENMIIVLEYIVNLFPFFYEIIVYFVRVS